MNRPGAFDRIVLPSGCAQRGATGAFALDLTGADLNPYFPSALQGLQDGLNWSNIRLVSNRLHATNVSGAPPYNDSVMFFPGTWGDDLTITATIYRGPNATAASGQEVELLICGEIGPTWARCYECMISVHGSNAYADIIRWNGGGGNALVNYTIAVHQTAGVPIVANTNTFKVTKVGNQITTSLDQGSGFTQMATLDITSVAANVYGPRVYTRGLPGLGLYQNGGTAGNLVEFGVTAYSVTAL